ncbi:MAG: capsular biosynthesis protein, partial [Moraxellaceae bacterium]
MPSDSDLPIDAVITWVDGQDPAHQAKLDAYTISLGGTRPRTASPTRFHNSGEINYCIKSLLRFAPWLRNIYIVTDNQTPEIVYKLHGSRFSSRIKVIDHRDIFVGYESALPTFNTRSITTMLWRIPGLSENFLYLNDDFLLIRPCSPENFFYDNKIILRGEWRTMSGDRGAMSHFFEKLFSVKRQSAQKRVSYSMAQQLAAKLLGF